MSSRANISPTLALGLGLFLARSGVSDREALESAMISVLTGRERVREASRTWKINAGSLSRSLQDFRDSIAAVCEKHGIDIRTLVTAVDGEHGSTDQEERVPCAA